MRKQKPFVLKTLAEIKVFLLFILDTVRYPIDASTLNMIITDNIEDITFDYEESLKDLVDSGHLLFDELDGEQYYMISDSGRLVSAELYQMIPQELREKSARCAAKYISLSKTGATIATKIEQLENKRYKVSFFAREGGCEVLSLSLVVPSKEQAEQMAAQFRERPDGFYRGIFFCATGKLEFLS